MKESNGWIFLVALFLTGVCFGSWLVMTISPEQRTSLWNWLSEIYKQQHTWMPVSELHSWQQATVTHLKWLLFLWICGCMVIGMPIVLLMNFFKGVMIGFTVGLYAVSASWKGVLSAGISLLPVHLVTVPLMLWISVSACSFALTVVRNRLINQSGPVFPAFWRHTVIGTAVIVLAMGGAWLEVKMVPEMIRWTWESWPGLRIFV